METTRLAGALGAEVTGIDFTRELDDAALAHVHRALLDHQVLLLRAPEMTPDQHMALGRRLGEIEVHAFFPNLGTGYEQVSVLDSDDGTTASMWHTDETFLEFPPMGTLTHAKVLPAVGGDTLFASTTAAYEALSVPMKRYLEGLSAVHDLSRVTELRLRFGSATVEEYAAAIAADRRHVHPVVRTHPETGAKGLFVNPTYTRHVVGLPPDESDMLLGHLFRHVTKEPFTYRHRWQVGDLLVWDNRATMHMVLADFAGRRLMYRVSVVGARGG
ncbi:MAG: TauD/TfdA family dioxygenase [Acidimicrobiales bacterium]|nr:TauD/TfdA family dioxygenase [Acidimicrobiales bacterium]